MRARTIGTVLLLLTATGVAWADRAESWLHGSERVAETAPGPMVDSWREMATIVERSRTGPAARPPIAAPFDYGGAGAEFGAARAGHTHEGQDLFAPAGTPLVAVRDGVVLNAGSDGGRGNYVEVYSKEAGETYAYFHMQEPAEVSPGERVRAGTELGRVGCTGSCYGDHLHFEVHAGEGAEARPIDPRPLLERWSR